jgi:hypothetical protein
MSSSTLPATGQQTDANPSISKQEKVMPALEPVDDRYLDSRVTAENKEQDELERLPVNALKEVMEVIRAGSVEEVNDYMLDLAKRNTIPRSYYSTVEERYLQRQKLLSLYEMGVNRLSA